MLLGEQEQFLSYNGEVLVFQLSKPKHVEGADDKTMNLCVRRMAFNRETKLFVQKSSGAFNMRASHSKIEMICCSCTTDSRTGIILPCILVKKKKRNTIKYLLLLLHSSNQFEQSFHFKMDYELREDIRLFAGPSVLWRHANKLFYISSNTCMVQRAPMQLSSVVWTGEIVGEGTVILGIRTACLQESEDTDEFSISDRAIWGSELFGYAIQTQKMLAGTCFMPHAYSRVVSSVYVCKNERVKKQLQISLVAVTHKNQLIWFQNGVPKGVCELPFEKPCSVKTAVTRSNDLLFVVFFASGNSCVVQRRDSLQVASKWQKVKSVLVDDFIGSGSEQLLLLFRDDSNTDVLSMFKITDLEVVNYASDISYKYDVPAAEGLQENGLLTIQALETRLQDQMNNLIYTSYWFCWKQATGWRFHVSCADKVVFTDMESFRRPHLFHLLGLNPAFSPLKFSLTCVLASSEDDILWQSIAVTLKQLSFPGQSLELLTLVVKDLLAYSRKDVPVPLSEREFMAGTTWSLVCHVAGFSSVRELQQHLKLKKKVILESCRALINLVEERTHILPKAKEEGLVSLWDDAENPPHSLSKETSLASKVGEHFTEKLWQRVVSDSLVVGVNLTDSFYLSLNDVSLSLVMDQDFPSISPIIKCQSKIIKLNKDFSALAVSSCQIEPPPKRMKLDLHSKNDLKGDFPKRPAGVQVDGAKTVIAVTSLSPLLAFHHVCCVVLLHAKKQKRGNDGLQESKTITVLCGKILLSLEDISNGRFSVKMLRDNSYCTGAMEDILAVLAASVRFSFQITSSDCTLTPVNSWLLGEMECTPFKECHDNIFCHKAGNVYGTIFNWSLKNPFEGVVTIFCRNLTVLFQCLHSLTRVLPPSCNVKLLRSGRKAVLTEQLALALEKEMLTSKCSFFSKESKAENTLMWGNEASKKIDNAPLASLLDTVEGVQQFRKKFQNEREQSVLSMNQTMNGALYQKIALKIAEAQLTSDMIVWRLSKS